MSEDKIKEMTVEEAVEALKEYKEKTHNFNKVMLKDMRYPFIEYMSYTLKRYGKKGTRYLKVLEEIVEKTRNDSFRSNTKRTF